MREDGTEDSLGPSSSSNTSRNTHESSGQPAVWANFGIGLTNARSLWQKTDSLAEWMVDHELDVAVVAETWFYECPALDKLMTDLERGQGISLINKARSNPGGGISIAFRKSKIYLKEFRVKCGRHEIVCTTGNMIKNTRPLYVLATYISTRLRAKSYHELLGLLSDAIMKIKMQTNDPYIILAGDFNNKGIQEALGDYPDIT